MLFGTYFDFSPQSWHMILLFLDMMFSIRWQLLECVCIPIADLLRPYLFFLEVYLIYLTVWTLTRVPNKINKQEIEEGFGHTTCNSHQNHLSLQSQRFPRINILLQFSGSLPTMLSRPWFANEQATMILQNTISNCAHGNSYELCRFQIIWEMYFYLVLCLLVFTNKMILILVVCDPHKLLHGGQIW